MILKRCLHTKPLVPLHSLHSIPKITATNENQPIIVHVHGAHGSCNDFKIQNREMSAKLHTPVYSVDLRNHGSSPWAFPYDNWTMAGDLANYICELSKKHGDKKVDLIGFSLGAKIALLTGFHKKANNVLNKVVSIDMPPGILKKLDKVVPTNAKEIQEIVETSEKYRLKQGVLAKTELHHLFVKQSDNDQSWMENLERHFLNVNNGNPFLTRYYVSGFHIGSKHLKAGEPVKHCMPILEMKSYLHEVCNWPTDILAKGNPIEINKTVINPVLFLRATQCQMFPKTEYYMDLIEELYPNHQIQDFDCWHSIHVQKKEEYFETVKKFLQC